MPNYSTNRDELKSTGFTLCKNVFTEEHFNWLYSTIFAMFLKHIPELESLSNEKNPLQQQKFHDLIRDLRKNEPQKFSDVYDCLQCSSSLYNFLTQPSLAALIAGIFSVTPAYVSITGLMMRMDAPSDSRNSLNWHQDRPYYPETLDSQNGIVVWIPLHDVDESLGSMVVCPGSHKEGVIATKVEKKDALGSEQREIPAEIINKYSGISIKAELGDVVLMALETFHRSGNNQSDKFRFTVGSRCHRMTSDYLPPSSLRYKANKKYPYDTGAY